MAIPRCELICHSDSAHLRQIYTGFALLDRAREIVVRQRFVKGRVLNYESQAPHLQDAGHAHLDVELESGKKLHFDTHDAADIALGELRQCDFYFKRSFSSAHVQALPVDQKHKVFPLGLNYGVCANGIDLHAARRGLVLGRSFRTRVASLKRALDVYERFGFYSRLKYMERPPGSTPNPKVLFLATTHDPKGSRLGAENMAERRLINDFRAECIARLRKDLGEHFFGGFRPSKLALERYPDLVVADPRVTAKANYLEIMKQHAICVATAGLHGSNGWKLAEYAACSRAILSQPLRHEVPGLFLAGRNYLEFTSPEQCAEKARELIENPELRMQLMTHNAEYYRAHLRPDALVRNALAIAAEQSASASALLAQARP